MFFACTHITLRETELPFWLEQGVEVVPEEVDTGVLTYTEALGYDDPNRHPVLDKCRGASTLNADAYTAARRVRLRQRGGMLDPDEQALFNASFGAVYVATDLATAAEVRRWFKGEVLFRYFGSFDYLRDIKDMARGLDPVLLRGITCLPIFDSLHELGLADLFGKVATVHGHMRPGSVGRTWDRHQAGNYAVTVMNGLAPGTLQEKLAQGMFGLAEKIPLQLLGKNAPDQAGKDIAEKLNVAGYLNRHEFLERFVRARLLVHPFAERYHNHYTNLEAVAAGIPVVFRTDNPLWNEQPAVWRNRVDAEHFGATDSDARRDRLAGQLFGDPDALARLAWRQRRLLSPFSARQIRREIAVVVGMLHWRRDGAAAGVNAADLPLTNVSGAQPLLWQAEAVQQHVPIPACALAREEDWRSIALDDAGRLVIRLAPNAPMRAFPLGNAAPIGPGRYRLTLGVRGESGALMRVRFELYQGRSCVAADERATDAAGTVSLVCEFAARGDSVLVMWLANAGVGSVDLLSLVLTPLGSAAQAPYLHWHDRISQRAAEGDRLGPAAFARGELIDQLVSGSDSWGPLVLPHRTKPWPIVLGGIEPLPAGHYRFELFGHVSAQSPFVATLEYLNGTEVLARDVALLEADLGVLLRAELALSEKASLLLFLDSPSDAELSVTGMQFTRLGQAPTLTVKINADPLADLLRTGSVAASRLAPGIAADGEKWPSLSVAGMQGPLVIGSGNVMPRGRYRMTLRGKDPSGAPLALHVELFSEDGVAAAADLTGPDPVDSRLQIEWVINAPEDWSLAIWPEAGRSVAARLDRLGLVRLADAAPVAALEVASTPQQGWVAGYRVGARHLLAWPGTAAGIDVPIGADGLEQAILPPFALATSALRCWLTLLDNNPFELVLELWRDNVRTSARSVLVAPEAGGQVVDLPVDDPVHAAGSVPVIYFQGPGQGRLHSVQALADGCTPR